MKNILKKITILIVFIFAGNFAQAQDTLRIVTSAQCESCKKLLEHDMRFAKGVESVSLDIDSKILTVLYNPAKTTPEKVRKEVAAIGYDADDVPADPKAYDKLNDCCKKGGHTPSAQPEHKH